MKTRLIPLLASFLSLVLSSSYAAPLDFSGSYSQDFDKLPHKTFPVPGDQVSDIPDLPGWQLYNFGEKRNSKYVGRDNGKILYSGFFSYAKEAKDNNRSLGAMTNNSKVSPIFGVVLKNTTGKTINTLDISYLGQQWGMTHTGADKNMKPQANTLFLSYKVSSDQVNIAGKAGDPSYTRAGTTFNINSPKLAIDAKNNKPTPVDGTLAENQIPVKGSLQNLNWAPDQYLILRWELPWKRYAENALAIDNLALEAR